MRSALKSPVSPKILSFVFKFKIEVRSIPNRPFVTITSPIVSVFASVGVSKSFVFMIYANE